MLNFNANDETLAAIIDCLQKTRSELGGNVRVLLNGAPVTAVEFRAPLPGIEDGYVNIYSE